MKWKTRTLKKNDFTLNCKRLSPPSCGGGELKGADDEQEALLTARLAFLSAQSRRARPGS
jgi:hypothetical protein